jgi:RND family efflux transporter MFP subunit
MIDKNTLLSELKIDRGEAPAASTGRLKRFVAPALVGIALLTGIAWYVGPSASAPRVQVATAHAPADSAPAAPLLEASGYVVARREATVSSKITGRVTELLIEEGQQVAAGQVLARLDGSNLAAALGQAEAQIDAAQANADLAGVNEANTRMRLARVDKLHRSGWISHQGLDDARTAYAAARENQEVARRQIAVARAARTVSGRNLDDTIIRAPFSGVVTVKAAQVGEIVSPISAGGGFTRTGIGTIVDMHSLEVEVDVAESYINRVRAGMPATVHLNAYPDWAIPAEVAAVIPTGDRSKATVKVRIRFKAEDPRIIPEMGAKVAFLNARTAQGPNAAGAVEIPAAAIVPLSGGGSAVFVVGNDLKLIRRAIRPGRKRGERQAVLGGLENGDRVVTAGLSDLHDGMTVRLNDN